MNTSGAPTTRRLKIGAVVLAAGASRRYGPENKLLVKLERQPLVVHVIARLTELALAQIVVVTPEADKSVAKAIAHLPVSVVLNPDPARGIGTSVACGVSGLANDMDGILIVPGDMPALTNELLVQLIALFATNKADRIVFPVDINGAQRNPVLWPSAYRARLEALQGDHGGKSLLVGQQDHIASLRVFNERALADVDVPDDLDRLQRVTIDGPKLS